MNRSARKIVLRRFASWLLRLLIFSVRIMPLGTALAMGRGLGTLIRVLSKKRYRVALKNLDIAYGDTLPSAEKERIARECFRHFGMFMVEVMKFAFLPQADIDRRIESDAEAEARFRKSREEYTGGCLFVTGHIGNFELMGRWGAPRGYEIIALMRDARDRDTTEIMTGLRERSGITVVSLRQSLKPILTGLKRKACIAIVCDQNATDVFVPFFGHPTGTADGPAKIALKTGAPLYFVFLVRTGIGRYRLLGEGPYWPQPSGDTQADIERIMTEVNRQIESVIRRYPEQWLWFHDRWKSSPDVQDNLAERAVSA